MIDLLAGSVPLDRVDDPTLGHAPYPMPVTRVLEPQYHVEYQINGCPCTTVYYPARPEAVQALQDILATSNHMATGAVIVETWRWVEYRAVVRRMLKLRPMPRW